MAGETVFAAKTNETVWSYAIEQTPCVLPPTPDWTALEPNDVTTFASTITTVARNPITPDRAGRKGSITDLDVAVEWEDDLTVASFRNFADGFLFSVWKEQVKANPTAVTASAYTHAALTASLTAGTLIFSRDFGESANNGVKRVASASTTTQTNVEETLSVESSPPTGSRFNVCGFQGATGDIEVNAGGHIVSTLYDFTTSDVDFYVGQIIYVGGTTTATQFDTAGVGTARITAISTNQLTLDDQSSSTWATDAGTGKTIQIYTGDFIRTVSTSDADFLNRTYQFEAAYNNLDDGAGGTQDGYEYIRAAQANIVTMNLPLTDKATISWGFIALDDEPVSTTQKTGNRLVSTDTDAYNTTSDFARLSLTDLSGNDLGAYFKDITLTINNNISAEKVLGRLGGIVNNIGNLELTATTQALFTSGDIINVVRNNTTVKFSWNVRNDDGALYFDLPAVTIGNATKNFPRNETVLVDIEITAFRDNTLGHVMSVTDFPFIPST